MAPVHIRAERLIDAPAEVVYHCIADYTRHHRPEGFLPPVFSDFTVERGGVGAGTTISFTMRVGGRSQRTTANISEPQPGRVLVESGPGVTTTFTVEPQGERARTRFETVLEAHGVVGLLSRLLAPRMLAPIYADELERLEQHARAHVEHASAG